MPNNIEIINELNLTMHYCSKDSFYDCEGIAFTDVYIIKLAIDGIPFEEINPSFEHSLIYYSELHKSSLSSGNYLIFTGCSGIADDAGWDYVNVKHKKELVIWSFQIDDSWFKYQFILSNYVHEILKLNITDEIKNQLEPKWVVYPE